MLSPSRTIAGVRHRTVRTGRQALNKLARMPSQLDIVLPCLDEAQALPWVLERIPDGSTAIVVDNGSTDGSPRGGTSRWRHCRRVRAARLRRGVPCGSGGRNRRIRCAFCDCDASLDPGDALRLVDLLRAGADLAVGRRVPTGRGAWPLHARLANRELARRVRRRTGVPLRDVGPLRAARRDATACPADHRPAQRLPT